MFKNLGPFLKWGLKPKLFYICCWAGPDKVRSKDAKTRGENPKTVVIYLKSVLKNNFFALVLKGKEHFLFARQNRTQAVNAKSSGRQRRY